MNFSVFVHVMIGVLTQCYLFFFPQESSDHITINGVSHLPCSCPFCSTEDGLFLHLFITLYHCSAQHTSFSSFFNLTVLKLVMTTLFLLCFPEDNSLRPLTSVLMIALAAGASTTSYHNSTGHAFAIFTPQAERGHSSPGPQ